MEVLNVAQGGLSAVWPEAATVGRIVLHTSLGMFFAASGWNKMTNAGRHQTIEATMVKDHIPLPRFNAWWVPAWELGAGLGLMTGIGTAFFAGVLLIICAVACMAEAKQRVADYHPINAADDVADWLYLPEVLYSVMLALIVLGV